MQEGKPEDPEKTCGSKYGLETKMHIWRRDYESNPGPLVHSAGEEPLRYLLPLCIQKIIKLSN